MQERKRLAADATFLFYVLQVVALDAKIFRKVGSGISRGGFFEHVAEISGPLDAVQWGTPIDSLAMHEGPRIGCGYTISALVLAVAGPGCSEFSSILLL